MDRGFSLLRKRLVKSMKKLIHNALYDVDGFGCATAISLILLLAIIAVFLISKIAY